MFSKPILFSCILALLLGGDRSAALVIRHDTPTLSYENYSKDAKFNASTGIARANDYEYGIAGATAIDSRWGVHARHTLRNVETWMDAGNGANLRGTKWTGWNYQGLGNVAVKKVIHFDDDFTRFANAIDIAVVQTVAKSSTLRIAPIYAAWDEVGRVGSGASAANNREDGNGNSRKTEAQDTSASNRWYEVRWAGKNDINQVNTQSLGSPSNALLKCDFDHPTNTSKSSMGGNIAIDLEYGTMNGDSGSPIYIDKDGLNGQVAGVLSGGSGSVYGSTLVYVRTRPYLTWITDTILANPDNRAVDLATIPDQIIALGDTLTVAATSTGTEQGPLTPRFSLVSPPTGMTINAGTGVITWTPTPSQAGITHTITVRVTEDGVVANSKDKSFTVNVLGSNSTTFWSWSAAPPNWSGFNSTGGNSGPYNLNNNKYPYLQGDANSMIYQQINGTIPAWVTVVVKIKAADFEQTWSNGGPLEYGFRNGQPTVANAADPFLQSAAAAVPNIDSATALADGLGNTGGNVDYSFTFETTAAIVNPWFAVRKNENGDRFTVDDIVVSYYITDTDGDGLADKEETNALGTDPTVADTDGDGLNDGIEITLGTNALNRDSDQDAWADGHEVNTLATNPLDGDDPAGPGTIGIGINFVSSVGNGIGVGLPANAYGGLPDVAQRNWNQTTPFSATSGNTSRITSPQAGVIVDSNGAATPVKLSCTMANLWSANNEKFSPYGPLYSGYLDTSSGTPNAVVTLSSIPYVNYDVYVYFGNNAATGRTGRITDGVTTYSFTSKAPFSTAGTYIKTTDTGTSYPTANYAVFPEKSGSTCTITYQRGSGNGGIHAIQIVPVTVLSPYEQWATDHLLDPATDGALTVDADKDGINNLIEFALYSDPSDPAARPMMMLEENATTLSIIYQKSRDLTAETVSAQWSDNMIDWYSTGITETQEGENSGSFTMKASVSKDGQDVRFLRVKVTSP